MNPEEESEFKVPEEEPKVFAKEVETPELDEDQYFIRIDKRKYSDEINRLEREDPHFKEVYHAKIGLRAQRKYQPEIDNLQRKYQDVVTNQQRREIASIPQEQLGSYLAQNPDVAAQYAEVMRQPDPTAILATQLQSEISRLLSVAVDQGLPDEKAEELSKGVESGKYDSMDVPTFLNKFYGEIINTLVESRDSSTPNTPSQKASTSQPVVNPNLLQGAAPSGQTTHRGNKMSKEEYNRLLQNSAEFIKRFPEENDLDKAIASGMIEGMGPNS